MSWNHNVHYHAAVVREIPSPCARALDVGCGRGELARKLAERCDRVIAIDSDGDCLEHARSTPRTNIAFVEGDFLDHRFEAGSFDFIATIATLHHVPLRAGLVRMRQLLRPGGVLVVIGLYRSVTSLDHIVDAFAFPVSRVMLWRSGDAEVGAPMKAPAETLRQIRDECEFVMPGGLFRRRLFFRYSFVWRHSTTGPPAAARY